MPVHVAGHTETRVRFSRLEPVSAGAVLADDTAHVREARTPHPLGKAEHLTVRSGFLPIGIAVLCHDSVTFDEFNVVDVVVIPDVLPAVPPEPVLILSAFQRFEPAVGPAAVAAQDRNAVCGVTR